MIRSRMTFGRSTRVASAVLGLVLLTGCEEGAQLPFLQSGDKTETPDAAATPKSTKLVERDVEAPDVFQVTEAGLWDGRPSLGGVWVAHPDVTDPERVIIRNTANGKFVIGALFRREREIPGPRFQASSDAAAALGMLAGAPVQLNVTALRREALEQTPEPDEPVAAREDAGEITQTALDPIAGAAAAIDAAPATAKPATKPATAKPGATKPAATPVAAAPAAAKPKPKAPSPGKPYIQIGIFSVEENANRTADQMRRAGMIPTVYAQKANGKAFWRVVVGPAQSGSDRTALLKKVKDAGFSDAYFVTN